MITLHEFELARTVESYDEYVRLNFGDADNVIYTIAHELNIPENWNRIRTRKGEYVQARIIASYVLRKFFGMISSTDVGKLLSTTDDHSVVHHYWHRAEDAFGTDAIWLMFGRDFRQICRGRGFDDKLKDVLIRFDDVYSAYKKNLDREVKKIEKSLDKSK